jgi:hypothetical protein
MAVTRQQVAVFGRLLSQIKSVQQEMALLSKGKPDNPVNKFKVQHINQFLAEANDLLGELFQPLKGFTQFDDAALPTNSDVVMVLAQYVGAFDRFRHANERNFGYERRWDLEEQAEDDGFEDDDETEESESDEQDIEEDE